MKLSVFENWNKERVDDENKDTIISIHVSPLIYVPPCVCFRLLEGWMCSYISYFIRLLSARHCNSFVSILFSNCVYCTAAVSERKLCFSFPISSPPPHTLYTYIVSLINFRIQFTTKKLKIIMENGL